MGHWNRVKLQNYIKPQQLMASLLETEVKKRLDSRRVLINIKKTKQQDNCYKYISVLEEAV